MFSLATFVPPETFKIRQKYYRCDSKFHLDEVIGILKATTSENIDKSCLTFIFGDYAYFYELLHDKVSSKISHKYLGNTKGIVNKRHTKGGQSQNRIARLREISIQAFEVKVTEKIIHYYSKEGLSEVKKIFLVGPGNKKNDVEKMLKNYNCFKNTSIILQSLDNISIDDKVIAKFISTNQEEILSGDNSEDLIIDNLTNMISKSEVDKLVFGNEVPHEYKENSLEVVYTTTELSWEPNKTKIIILTSKRAVDYLEDFGGTIGVKYYEAN